MLQRDIFIKTIHAAAREDRDIILLSADFGAQSLDTFREELPAQFIHCGISEQHMIDMAAGLSMAGKKVFVYCMGPFLSLRCYEQTKCCLAMMDRPVTLIGAGVGLGYADSGPTHYLTEDIACMRALNGISVLTPADEVAAAAMAQECLTEPGLRYIRLDREALPAIYPPMPAQLGRHLGFHELQRGDGVCILSSGYLLHRVLEASNLLAQDGVYPGVIDLFRVKPINTEALAQALQRYYAVVTVEEQCLAGGFGSAVLEALSDNGLIKPVHRMGLPERYVFENGGRARLLDGFGLSVDGIRAAVRDFRARQLDVA